MPGAVTVQGLGQAICVRKYPLKAFSKELLKRTFSCLGSLDTYGEDNMANMKEIAKMARVSIGTVSHVLNNSANVRESMRKRVLEAVHAPPYHPNHLSRALRRAKTTI